MAAYSAALSASDIWFTGVAGAPVDLRLDPEGGGLRDRRAGFQESLGDLGASPFGC